MGKATTKTMKDSAKKKAAKINGPLLDALASIKEHIAELNDVYEAKTPLQDKLPRDSVYYSHYMNRM